MKKIILASKSPRRIEMLKRYFNDLIIYFPNIDETVYSNDEPQITVMKIAFDKARYASYYCGEKGIIISADTLVYLNKPMGKPIDYNEGYEMLKALSGKIHKVYTGVCIWDSLTNKKLVDYEETSVEFNDLSHNLIEKYLNTGEYKDKAGSYAIQGYGELLIKRINGCYNNVKGLPLTKLNDLLTKHFSQELL